MALRRKDLTAMDIPAEKIDVIINAHMETVNALQEERDSFKAKADLAESLQKELEDVRKELSETQKEDFKTKYEELSKEYEDFKTDVENQKTRASKIEAFKSILAEIGITGEKQIAKVIDGADFDSMELDDKGKLKDAKEIAKRTASEWEFIVPKKRIEGADPATPPENNGGNTFEKMSLSEKMAFANENPDSPEVKDWLNK